MMPPNLEPLFYMSTLANFYEEQDFELKEVSVSMFRSCKDGGVEFRGFVECNGCFNH